MVGDMSVGGVGRSIILLAAVLLTAGNAPADSSMSMDTTAGAPGTTNLVPVNVLIDTNVVSLQFDLLYATNDLTPGTPVGGNALSDQQLFSNVVSPGQFRVLAISFADTPLTNGVAVYVPFAIGAEASDHDEPLVLSNVVLVSAQAEAVPVTVASNATLSITVPPHFTAVVPTGAGVIHFELTGTTNRVYAIEATPDLAQPEWSALTTNTATNGVVPFDDDAAGTYSNRFFRGRFIR